MFTSNFERYLSITPTNDVINICEPLFRNIGINYFLYLRIYADGTRTFLSTYPDLIKWIYNEKNSMSASASKIKGGI